VAASGDRVRVLESDLGPGEMPARAFSAATSTEPEPGSRYMVRRDENLWQIAADARPEGVSVQQAMLDIQRLNPEAFIAGNINRIKAGYIIYLPSAADISSDDLAEALAEVSAQNRAWTSGRGPEPGVSAAASLRISAAGEEPAAVSASDSAGQTAPPRDRESRDNEETAARADAGDTTTDAEVPAESGPATDSADSEGGAGDELAAQFAAMNERLDALEGMLAVKDAEIARLQAALREAEAADARDATASAGPASAATDPAEEAPSTSRPATSTPTPTPAPAPAPSPVQKPPAPVPDSSSGGLLPWLYGLGAAVLLALLAVVGLRRFSASRARRGQQVGGGARATAAADDPFSDVTLKGEPDASLEDAAAATPGAGPAPEPEDATAPPDVSERGYGERRYDDYSDDAEGNDALAEADIYIAYGRYLQAVELLSSAIRTEPENSAFRIKLLELYLDMGEEANAREQLDALRESGDAAAIERAERILGSGRAGSGQPAPAAEPQHEAAEESGQVGETGARELAPIEYDRPGGAGASAPAQAPDADARDEALSRPAPAPDTTSGEEEPGADQEELRADEEDPLALDAGLEELAIEEELPLAPGSLEDELDFGDIAGDRVPAAEAIDLGEPESAIPEPEVTETHAPWDAQDEHSDGSGDLVFAEDADRMATRLDLARAYLDMGDADGARTILEEVARAGDEEQQGEARKLLDNLA
jgi:pilus assembly protein FimV